MDGNLHPMEYYKIKLAAFPAKNESENLFFLGYTYISNVMGSCNVVML